MAEVLLEVASDHFRRPDRDVPLINQNLIAFEICELELGVARVLELVGEELVLTENDDPPGVL